MHGEKDRDDARWRVLAAESLHENPWFRVLKSAVRTPHGREFTYFTLDFPRRAVGVVPRRKKEVLLIRQHRFIVDRFVWAIPSGGVEKAEDGRVAAERELVEETGYRAKELRELQRYFPSYGCGNQEFLLYEAEVAEEQPRAFDRDEVIEMRWFAEREVKRMCFEGEIVDGLSLTPLLLLCAREGW